jgi:hypothetical protein
MKPREVLFDVEVSVRRRLRCEIRDQGAAGFDVQFFKDDELFASRRFATYAGAWAWAEDERKAIKKGTGRLTKGGEQ